MTGSTLSLIPKVPFAVDRGVLFVVLAQDWTSPLASTVKIIAPNT